MLCRSYPSSKRFSGRRCALPSGNTENGVLLETLCFAFLLIQVFPIRRIRHFEWLSGKGKRNDAAIEQAQRLPPKRKMTPGGAGPRGEHAILYGLIGTKEVSSAAGRQCVRATHRVSKVKIVREWYVSPGRRMVDGKVGSFGLFGKCCVSRQKPARCS